MWLTWLRRYYRTETEFAKIPALWASGPFCGRGRYPAPGQIGPSAIREAQQALPEENDAIATNGLRFAAAHLGATREKAHVRWIF